MGDVFTLYNFVLLASLKKWEWFSGPLCFGHNLLHLALCALAIIYYTWGSWNSMLVERQIRDWMVASLNPSRSGGRIFFSRVNFVCWLLFSVHSTSVLPQWYVKDPSHSAKSAGGRLHLTMHTPLTQQSWSGLTISPGGVGTYLETSSHATCQGTLILILA